MKNIKVFKVGGSVLAEPEDFLKIAKLLLKFKTTAICLVTSAMKGETDKLIDLYMRAVPQPDFYGFERFAGMGEILAALIFESVFKALNAQARTILPGMAEWPIHIRLQSKGQLSAQKINEKREFTLLPIASKIASRFLLPLLNKNTILVIPGFIAQDEKKNIVTLGRGGSDISALLIAELLNAQELVLVKDVGGILSVDPKIVSNSRMIKKLSWAELGALAASGAQVLNPISLKHRKNLQKIRVIAQDGKNLENGGTEIVFDKEVSITLAEKIYGVLTFIGERIPETPGILSKVAQTLTEKKVAVHSLTISDNLLAIYVEESRVEEAYEHLSKLIPEIKNFKALNLKKGIAKIVVRSLKFINEPGAIKKIATPLSREKINIWEILTVHTDIMIFVEAQDKIRAYNLIKQLFKKE
ncbi:MAG: ACT domain-containing protein [candidate division WOR-3 bacterium]